MNRMYDLLEFHKPASRQAATKQPKAWSSSSIMHNPEVQFARQCGDPTRNKFKPCCTNPKTLLRGLIGVIDPLGSYIVQLNSAFIDSPGQISSFSSRPSANSSLYLQALRMAISKECGKIT
jgi:hypothetical protein